MTIHPILRALLRSKTGAVLVALQITISLGILCNAMHVVNLRYSAMDRPSGLADESTVFYLRVKHLHEASHEEELAFQKRETALLRSTPGIASVAIANQTPLSGSGNTNGVFLSRDQTISTAQASTYESPDSLVQTWGLNLRQGRDFAASDVQEVARKSTRMTPKIAIISEALAKKLFPNLDSAVGKTLFLGNGESALPLQIVGVLARLQSANRPYPGADIEYSLIVPVRATFNNAWIYTLRAAPGQRDRAMRDAEATLRKSSALPMLITPSTMAKDRAEFYSDDTSLAWMLVAVSVLLLLITASGIVGMTSLRVTQRRKQIGVRRALGATRVDILHYFMVENLIVTSVGVAGGVLLGLGLNALLVSQLEMVRLPLGYLGVGAAVLLALGALAALVPAWRGACISPAVATRSV